MASYLRTYIYTNILQLPLNDTKTGCRLESQVGKKKPFSVSESGLSLTITVYYYLHRCCTCNIVEKKKRGIIDKKKLPLERGDDGIDNNICIGGIGERTKKIVYFVKCNTINSPGKRPPFSPMASAHVCVLKFSLHINALVPKVKAKQARQAGRPGQARSSKMNIYPPHGEKTHF